MPSCQFCPEDFLGEGSASMVGPHAAATWWPAVSSGPQGELAMAPPQKTFPSKRFS